MQHKKCPRCGHEYMIPEIYAGFPGHWCSECHLTIGLSRVAKVFWWATSYAVIAHEKGASVPWFKGYYRYLRWRLWKVLGLVKEETVYMEVKKK